MILPAPAQALRLPATAAPTSALPPAPLKDEEKAGGLTETIVALDGIAVIVNADSKVADLTVEQIGKIFTGEITDWSEVGGDAGTISCIGRGGGQRRPGGVVDTHRRPTEVSVANDVVRTTNDVDPYPPGPGRSVYGTGRGSGPDPEPRTRTRTRTVNRYPVPYPLPVPVRPVTGSGKRVRVKPG